MGFCLVLGHELEPNDNKNHQANCGLNKETRNNYSARARKRTSEKSTLALEPRANVTKSPKQEYQWSHEKDLCPPRFKKKEKKRNNCVMSSGPIYCKFSEYKLF